jgi:hypothetical protein
MKLRRVWIPLLFWGLCSSPARADNRVIVRTTNLPALQALCLPLLQTCTVVEGLDGTLNQLFLVTTPLDVTTFLNLLNGTLGIVDAEADQLLSLNSLNQVGTPPPGLSDSTPVNYYGSTVWDGYVNQPAAQIVRVSQAQSTFQVTGKGIVADIDTGVDPNHPALQSVLLPGYDFTRNQPGGSVMTDFTGTPPSGNTGNIAQVNQSTAAVLDQSTAAVLDCNQQTPCQYAAFGHGTMVMGVIHLVAPEAQLLPLKAFSSDGTGDLSNILHAVYYGVQNGANVINMSFDMTSNSLEFSKAMDYANQNGVICAASAGNDGMEEIVYPAAYQNDVMGVASTSNTDTRSSFSNYGDAIVWVAAPGEAIISTYPFGTYAAGWGTSFSAPFVSGAAALLRNRQSNINESRAAAAVAHAVPIGPDMGHGRLDLVQALQATSGLRFVPVMPCRVADTRNANGPFGGPFLTGGNSRAFAVPNSTCGIPAAAQAYSVNVTVVPHVPLGYLTVFPCGEMQPFVSTLNSLDGRIKAGAAIVPAGTGGAICFFVTDDTELVLDINGYFVPAENTSALAFYPVTPCRLVDTRLQNGALGGPFLAGNAARTFPILSSSCNVPSTAQAYSLNFTSVPRGTLGFLTAWPAGQTQPLVSTLNAPTGTVTANAAIVPAGMNGDVSVFVTNDSDLVIDIDGYFAPPGTGTGGLSLYNLVPCRVLDTRNPPGSPPFAGTLNVNVAASGCGAPVSAQSYVLNATVVPQGALGYLTLWAQGAAQPFVSTLNAWDASVTSNMAIVPTTNGSVSAFATDSTHLVLDISAYFAP